MSDVMMQFLADLKARKEKTVRMGPDTEYDRLELISAIERKFNQPTHSTDDVLGYVSGVWDRTPTDRCLEVAITKDVYDMFDLKKLNLGDQYQGSDWVIADAANMGTDDEGEIIADGPYVMLLEHKDSYDGSDQA